MIELRDFTGSDFDTLKSWINSEEELIQFAGSIFMFPLTDEQLQNYINIPDIKPFKVVLSATNETIGHCELNYENGNNRLSRILIGNKDARGKGICKQIVLKMIEMLLEDSAVNEVDLYVFDWNKRALKCYENIGFEINPQKTKKLEVNGKTWNSLNMTLKRKNRLQ
ncbi:MAG: GNAT family protein [Bacteroidota bacterium]